jgi:hypothetical protein
MEFEQLEEERIVLGEHEEFYKLMGGLSTLYLE